MGRGEKRKKTYGKGDGENSSIDCTDEIYDAKQGESEFESEGGSW